MILSIQMKIIRHRRHVHCSNRNYTFAAGCLHSANVTYLPDDRPKKKEKKEKETFVLTGGVPDDNEK